MGNKSKVRRLPQPIRNELDRLLTEGQLGIREITEHLRGLGADVSKSAVGRYSQSFEQVAKDIRDSRLMAEALAEQLSDPDGPNVTRLAVASLEGLLMRAQRQLVAPDGSVDVKTLGSLAESLRNIQSAYKTNVDAETKIRAQVAKEAATVVEKVAGERGLTKETVEDIKQAVLGVARKS